MSTAQFTLKMSVLYASVLSAVNLQKLRIRKKASSVKNSSDSVEMPHTSAVSVRDEGERSMFYSRSSAKINTKALGAPKDMKLGGVVFQHP